MSDYPVYPVYQDAAASVDLRRGQLPFYININRIRHSELHHHDFAELMLVVRGSGYELLNGSRHDIREGSVSLLLPHHMHEIRSSASDPLEVYCCMFDISVLSGSEYDSELSRLLLSKEKALPPYFDLNEHQFGRIRTILQELHTEYKGSEFGKDTIVRAKLMEALMLVLRYGMQRMPSETGDSGGGRYPDPFWKILRYVHLHYCGILTLQELSSAFNQSVSHICRSFRKHTGKSFVEYVHALRITRACSLLVTTAMSVTDISVEVGFEHVRTFTRVFKSSKSMSPTAYRQSHASSGELGKGFLR